MKNDGTVMRNGHESQIWRGQGLSSHEPSGECASADSLPGILLFSHRGQLLHMTRRAVDLIGDLNQVGNVPDNHARSALVRKFLAQIQETLDHRIATNIWDAFELKHVIFEAERKLLVRGFGLVNQDSYNDSRIVIVLEEVSLRQEHKAQPASVRAFPSDSRCAVT
ncbi:MAG TPA: hypothetical protein VLL94_14295 [Nitrospiraceae bacterium]|nr:hypothetical protein [Nitrospiraceae bacterium]